MTSEMMRKLLVAGSAIAALSVGGCASVPGLGGSSQTAEHLLSNLQGCSRTYTGGTGLGANLSFHIECKPSAPAAPPPPTIDDAIPR